MPTNLNTINNMNKIIMIIIITTIITIIMIIIIIIIITTIIIINIIFANGVYLLSFTRNYYSIYNSSISYQVPHYHISSCHININDWKWKRAVYPTGSLHVHNSRIKNKEQIRFLSTGHTTLTNHGVMTLSMNQRWFIVDSTSCA